MAENATIASQGFAALLADDFVSSKTRYLTAFGLIAMLAILHRLSTPFLEEREPPLHKPIIPIIGHLIGLMRYSGGYLNMIYEATHKPIVTLPILGGKLYVVLDPAIVQSAYRNRKLTFEPFALEFGQRELGFGNETLKKLTTTNFLPDFFAIPHPAMMGKPLHQMNTNALNYVSQKLDHIGQNGKPVTVPNIYQWVRDLMTLATTQALFGPENPFDKDKSLVKDLWTFEAGLTGLLLNIFPSITTPNAYRARARVQAGLHRYYEAKHDQDGDAAEVVRLRAGVLRKYDVPEVGPFELSILHVATANSIPSLFWFIVHIFSRPDLVERLRDELSPMAQHGDNDEVTIDITTLDKRCPLLISCYKEAMRLSNQAVGNRRIQEDTTVSDGKGNTYLLKKGFNIQMSIVTLHTSPEYWGQDALEFDPERFIEKEGKSNSESEKTKKAAYVPFGGGKHMCPGRYFAAAENVSFVACLLLGFDLLPLDAMATAIEVPVMQPCPMTDAAAKPAHQGAGNGMRIQRRKGWETTKWNFSC